MGRQLKGLLYFFITDMRYSLFVFWTVLLSTLAVTLVIAYFLIGVDSGQIGFTLPIALYIYCGITGFLTVKLSIPFSIKVGATRKNVFIGMGIFFLGLSGVLGVMVNSIQSLVDFLNTKIGIESFLFMHIANLMDTTWLGRVLIDTSVMFFFLSLLFVIGLCFYKFGLAGGGSIVALLVIVILVGAAQGWLIDFFIHIYQTLNVVFFWQLLLVGILIYCISWLMMRRITIIK